MLIVFFCVSICFYVSLLDGMFLTINHLKLLFLIHLNQLNTSTSSGKISFPLATRQIWKNFSFLTLFHCISSFDSYSQSPSRHKLNIESSQLFSKCITLLKYTPHQKVLQSRWGNNIVYQTFIWMVFLLFFLPAPAALWLPSADVWRHHGG